MLVTAIHGGGIEPGTTELARRVANIGEYDFYTFEGLMPKHNERLHITSTVFDEPTLLKMLDHSDETISIHGYSGEDPIVYVGGKDKKLAKSITKSLKIEVSLFKRALKVLKRHHHLILLIEVIMIQAFNLN